jgi:hypothetical protein
MCEHGQEGPRIYEWSGRILLRSDSARKEGGIGELENAIGDMGAFGANAS